MLTETFESIVEQLIEACIGVYGDRLTGVVLYGSVASGQTGPDSDIDILVVATDLPQGRIPRMEEFAEVERRVEAVIRGACDRGVNTYISALVFAPDELDALGFLGFDIACDGIVRYDPTGAVGDHLERVRAKLHARGAERRVLHGSKYWVLKPDVRPGEVIEI